MRKIKRIIVHCSDTEEGTVESIRKYHIEVKGWQDVGYHYVILRDGAIESGRSPDVVGAHCKGHNEDSLGICLVGKLGRYTLKQLLSLKHLTDKLRDIYGIGIGSIFCHYELDQHGKTCPDFTKDDLLKLLTSVL